MASVIETKINRLASAKAAIKAAIEGKGVTVPDATLLDGMAALIESIQAGGGKLYIEQRTMASDVEAVTISHNLGEIPSIIVQCMMESTSGKYTRKARIGLGYIKGGILYGTTAYNSSSSGEFKFQTTAPVRNRSQITNTACSFIPCGGSTAGSYYYAGDTYIFILIGGVEL